MRPLAVIDAHVFSLSQQKTNFVPWVSQTKLMNSIYAVSECRNDRIGLKLQSYLQSSLAPRNNNENALKNFLALTDFDPTDDGQSFFLYSN